MNRVYVRGNKEHKEEIARYFNDTIGFIYNKNMHYDSSSFIYFIDYLDWHDHDAIIRSANQETSTYDAITTNPNWQEVKPWKEKPYEPKPFDKVLAWDEEGEIPSPTLFSAYFPDEDYPYQSIGGSNWKHMNPYDEEEYLKSLEK